MMDGVERYETARPAFIAGLIGGLVAGLIWGQAQYISGFDHGVDTSACVQSALQTHEPTGAIPACQAVPVNGIRMKLLRVYRRAVGDGIEDQPHES